MSNTIFIIAHAPLAQALRECAMHVYAECAPTVLALDVQASAEPEDTLDQAQALLAHVPRDEGLLVLTDIFGATPANVAQKIVQARDAQLIAGVNVPMLFRSVCYRHEPLDVLVSRALSGGTQGVMQVAISAPQTQTQKTYASNHDHHQQ